MQAKDGSQRSTRRPHLGLVGVVVALALLGSACHGFLDPRHQGSVHELLEYELYCWETWDSGIIDEEDAQSFLDDALFPEGTHFAESWSAVHTFPSPANVLILFPLGSCPNPHPPEDEQTWISYQFMTDALAYAYCGGTSCANHHNPECYLNDDDEQHCHYQHQHVILEDSTMGSSPALRRHTINHETGHVLGLLDPIEPYDAIGWNHCRVDLAEWLQLEGLQMIRWVDSIMHAPPSYCSAYAPEDVYEWPRPGDHTGVAYIMEFKDIKTEWQ